MGELEAKGALITGAGSGTGEASAKVFVREPELGAFFGSDRISNINGAVITFDGGHGIRFA